MKKRKIVAFDFDGTIADSPKIQIELAKHIIPQIWPITRKLKLVDPLEYVRENGYLALLKELRFPIILIPFLVSKIKKEQADVIDRVKIIPGMLQVLQTLSETCDIYILTGNNSKYITRFLSTNKIDKVFKGIFSDASNFGKRHVFKGFKKSILSGLNTGFYIGDEVGDIQESQKIGLKCICSSWGITSKTVLLNNNPYAVAEKPDDIVKIINAA